MISNIFFKGSSITCYLHIRKIDFIDMAVAHLGETNKPHTHRKDEPEAQETGCRRWAEPTGEMKWAGHWRIPVVENPKKILSTPI